MSNRNTIIFIGALALIAILMGINYFTTPFQDWYEQLGSQEEAAQEEKLPQPTLTANEQFMQKLSPEQRVAQLISYPLNFETQTGAASAVSQATDSGTVEEQSVQTQYPAEASQIEQVADLEPGFVTVFGSDVSLQQAKDVLGSMQKSFSNKDLSPIVAVDHEGGSVQRLSGEGFTELPSWEDACQLESTDLREQLAQSAQELQAAGINIVFAPVVDLGGSVLGSRSCNSLEALLPAASSYIRTFGQYQIMSVAKHFPGIGETTRDLHNGPDEIRINPDSILVYSTLLDAYPNIGVMTTHVSVEDRFNGLPCSLSQACLKTFPQQYPEVLIFSDALNMGAVESLIAEEASIEADNATSSASETEAPQFQDMAEIAKQAIMAGNDVILFGYEMNVEEIKTIRSQLAKWYQEDPEFAQRVDESLGKIINMKSIDKKE